jgi:hypothetical protein
LEDAMARIVFALICACCAWSVHATPPRQTVYLDDSATWEALKREQPRRYEKILEVVKVAEAEPCETAPAIIKTKLDVNAKCRAMVLFTSYPAKTRLLFTVEDTDYAVFVVQAKLSAGKLIPAR